MSKADDKRKARSAWEVVRAIETLRDNGAILLLPDTVIGRRVTLYSLKETAAMIGMSVDWIRIHRDEFPNLVKAPGGDMRIPLSDIEHALDRWRVKKNGLNST